MIFIKPSLGSTLNKLLISCNNNCYWLTMHCLYYAVMLASFHNGFACFDLGTTLVVNLKIM